MSKLDDAIHEALSEEDAEFLARFNEEPHSFEQMFGIFRGPLSWMYVAFAVFALILAPITIYTGWRFFEATEMRPLFYWGLTTTVSVLLLAVVRVLLFMQLNTNRVLREIKRLELHLARLAAREKA